MPAPINHPHNDIVGYYLAAVTVFYGITLGLVAVGTWTPCFDVGTRLDREADVASSLCRDVGGYPEPIRDSLQKNLRDHPDNVINVGWQQQRRGIVPAGSAMFLERFQKQMLAFAPGTPSQQILHAGSYSGSTT